MATSAIERECIAVERGLDSKCDADRVFAVARIGRLAADRFAEEADMNPPTAETCCLLARVLYKASALVKNERKCPGSVSRVAFRTVSAFGSVRRTWILERVLLSELVSEVCKTVFGDAFPEELAGRARERAVACLWNFSRLVGLNGFLVWVLANERVVELAREPFDLARGASVAFRLFASATDVLGDILRSEARSVVPVAFAIVNSGMASREDVGAALSVLSHSIYDNRTALHVVRGVTSMDRVLDHARGGGVSGLAAVCLFLKRVFTGLFRSCIVLTPRPPPGVLWRFDVDRLLEVLARGVACGDNSVRAHACTALEFAVRLGSEACRRARANGAVRELLRVMCDAPGLRSRRHRAREKRGKGRVPAGVCPPTAEVRQAAAQALDSIRLKSERGAAAQILRDMAHPRAIELLVWVVARSFAPRERIEWAMRLVAEIVKRWLADHRGAECPEWACARNLRADKKRKADFVRAVQTGAFPCMFGGRKPRPPDDPEPREQWPPVWQ